MMNEPGNVGVTTGDSLPNKEELAENMCQGFWKLKHNVVLRVEEDGVILFDPDTDSLSVINATGSALLRWRRDRICYSDLCEALHRHYKKEVGLVQIQADVKKFLGEISHFAESCLNDGESN